MLESFFIILIGIAFIIGATILTDYGPRHYEVYETIRLNRYLIDRFGRRGLYTASIIECVIMGYFGITVFDYLGLWGLIWSIVITLLCGCDFFHDLNVLRKAKRVHP